MQRSNQLLAVFDLDGTLLDTIGDLAASCNAMLRSRSLAEHTLADYRHFVGNGITRLVERALPEELRTSDYIASARRDFMAYYIEHLDHYTQPYDGIGELLSALSARGVRLAVASNKFDAATKSLVGRFFPDIRFEAVWGNRDGFPLKPDAAILHQIMEESGTTPDHCYMIGDSGVDMLTAHAAGAHSIGVEWGFRSREELVEHRAEHIVSSPEEVLSIIVAG
jgi:phosphoglycolate phosphatase